MITKRLRESWTRRKGRAFPPGAVTFHLAAWNRGTLVPEERVAIRDLMAAHGFSHLLVLHGNALGIREQTVLLLGPAGIGKSTASRRLVRTGTATLIEDGLVVVGVDAGGWKVVETGAFGVLHGAARISGLLRRVAPGPSNPYRSPAPGTHGRRSVLGRFLENLAFKGGILLAERDRTPMKRRLFPVARVELFEHACSGFSSYRSDGQSLAPIEDLAPLVPTGVVFRRHSLIGEARDVHARLATSVLDEPVA